MSQKEFDSLVEKVRIYVGNNARVYGRVCVENIMMRFNVKEQFASLALYKVTQEVPL